VLVTFLPADTTSLMAGRYVMEVFVTIAGKKYRLLWDEVQIRD
jgi:hypothetical protein